MKFTKIAVAVAAGLIASSVFAAQSTQASSQTQKAAQPSSAQLAVLQAKLDKLKDQLNAIDNTAHFIRSSAHLSRINNFYDKGRMHTRAQGFLLDTLPSVTYELALLQQEAKYDARGVSFGGYIEQDTQYWNGDNIPTTSGTTYHHGTGTYLTSLNYDILGKVNDWVSVFSRQEITNLGASNEAFSVHDALFVLGDLNKSPFYGSFGKTYVPWGSFAGNGVWDVALTRSVFRPSTIPQIIMGYYHDGLNTSLSVFNTNDSRQNITNFAYSANYAKNFTNAGFSLGFGYLNDIRGDSSTIGSAFDPGGVYAVAGNRRNAGYDFNGSISYGMFTLNGEYIFTQRTVKLASTVVNQGKPRVWEVGVLATPTIRGKSLQLGASYSHTSNLAGLPMALGGYANPGQTSSTGFKSQWIGFINRPITRNYYLGVEGVYDNLYNNLHTYEFTIDNSIYF